MSKGLPDAITVKSVTGSTMVWSYNGIPFGEEKGKNYIADQEVTYVKL
jgi:hypothetical protein